MAKRKAPYKDFKGKDLFEGDSIKHPNGEEGVILCLANDWDVSEKWRVDYGDGSWLSALRLQVDRKGRAVKSN